MTKKYPLLTVENVRYWYWEHDPPMSGHDIAKEVGCYFQLVYEFMRQYGILIRNYSQASRELFDTPQKYQAYLKARTSPKYLQKQSESHKKLWEDPEFRDKRSKLMKEINGRILTNTEKVILFVLRDGTKKFVIDLVNLTSLDKDTQYRNLARLKNRDLISSEKVVERRRNQYWILTKGLNLLHYIQKTAPFDIDNLIKEVKNQKPQRLDVIESNKNFLGSNQTVILKTLFEENEKSYFAKEIGTLTNLKKASKSLLGLYKRGYIDRKKESNPNATGANKKAYKYHLTEEGEKLIKSKLKIL